MVVQRVRSEGRQQAFTAALEQGDVEILLQLTDLLRQRRLRDRQALSRTADMAFFVDRDEITQLFEIHK